VPEHEAAEAPVLAEAPLLAAAVSLAEAPVLAEPPELAEALEPAAALEPPETPVPADDVDGVELLPELDEQAASATEAAIATAITERWLRFTGRLLGEEVGGLAAVQAIAGWASSAGSPM
jgi:hypothetical protein